MTDTITNLNPFKMNSIKRPLVGEYKKTIILVTGPSNSGKSTISDELEKDDLSYISADILCLSDHHICQFEDYIQKCTIDGIPDIGAACLLLNLSGKSCLEFIDFMFDYYIIPNKAKNILLDGYMLTLGNIRYNFLDKCEQLNYYVWELRRVQ